MPSNKRKKSRTIKNKKKSRSTQKKMRGGLYNSSENSNENSIEYEKTFNTYCKYIFGDPERKLERLEESNASKEIYEEQARKIENDRYFVLCFWGFIPYFAFKKIDEMEKINSR